MSPRGRCALVDEEATDGELDGLKDFNTCERLELEIFRKSVKFANVAGVFDIYLRMTFQLMWTSDVTDIIDTIDKCCV